MQNRKQNSEEAYNSELLLKRVETTRFGHIVETVRLVTCWPCSEDNYHDHHVIIRDGNGTTFVRCNAIQDPGTGHPQESCVDPTLGYGRDQAKLGLRWKCVEYDHQGIELRGKKPMWLNPYEPKQAEILKNAMGAKRFSDLMRKIDSNPFWAPGIQTYGKA